MHGFFRFTKGFSTTLNAFAAVALILMTVLVCTDVVLRIFGRSILGAYEIVGFLGAIVSAFALPQTTLDKKHVSVEVLINHFPAHFKRTTRILADLLALCLFGFITYAGIAYGYDLKVSHETSMTLRLPVFPVLYGIAFSSFVVMLVYLRDLILLFKKDKAKQ